VNENLSKEKTPSAIIIRFCFAQSVAILSSLAAYPFDTIHRRLQTQSDKPMEDRIYKNTIDCGYKILFNEGVKGYYKGASVVLLRTVFSAVLLVAYDSVKSMLNKR